MALIACSDCGKKISDKASACVGCGAPVSPQVECVDCGNLNSASAAVCENCGGPIGTERSIFEAQNNADSFASYSANNPARNSSHNESNYGNQRRFSEVADRASPAYDRRQEEQNIINDKLSASFTEKLRLYFSTIVIFFIGYAALNVLSFNVLREEWGLDGYILDDILFPFAFWGSAVCAALLALGNYDYKLRYVRDISALIRIIIAAPIGFFLAYMIGISDFTAEFVMEMAFNSRSIRSFDIQGASNELGGVLILFSNVIPLVMVLITQWILLLPLKSTGKE